jgi:ABC-2 type transport system permease protein
MISDQPIALANQDTGVMSATFVSELNLINNKTGMMDLRSAEDFEDIKTKIQNSEVNAGIIIPENFSSNILAGNQGYVSIIIDQSNPQMASMIQAVL